MRLIQLHTLVLGDKVPESCCTLALKQNNRLLPQQSSYLVGRDRSLETGSLKKNNPSLEATPALWILATCNTHILWIRGNC